MSSRRFFPAAATGLALVAAIATSSAPAREPLLLPRASVPEAITGDLGTAMMSAVINTDGSIFEAAGVVKSSYSDTRKNYLLQFDRSLLGCVASVTPAFSGATASSQTVIPLLSNAALVELRTDDGAPTAGPFYIFLFCSE